MNMEELRSLSARYFRAADPQAQVAALDEAVAAGDTWHSLDNSLRLDLVTGLRDNAQSIHELRDVLPHFTVDRIRYDETALQGLVCGANVLEALFAELENIEPEARLTAQQANDILKRTGQRSGAKGRALYHPIRLGLTGSDAGPEISALFTLLNADTLRTRIRSALNILPPSKNKD
jgi:glutamyl/glutaminyl-tRNA synthetase